MIGIGFDTPGDIQRNPFRVPAGNDPWQPMDMGGFNQVLENGLWDPLGSRFYDTNKKRKRRFAPGKTVTKV